MVRLQRHPENPILQPRSHVDWEAGAVFNCGATLDDQGRVRLLYRAVARGYRPKPQGRGYDNYISSVGMAVSDDGVHFTLQPKPVLRPEAPWDPWGCEDPRVTRLDLEGRPTWWVTYTAMTEPAFAGHGNRVGLARTHDFRTFHKHGHLLPGVESKNAVLFPELHRGRVVLLHRMMPSIYIAFLPPEFLWEPDPAFWEAYLVRAADYVLMEPRFPWEEAKIGAGPPPIPTEAGWVLFYHGVDRHRVYRVGVALLDREDPARVLARLPYPLMEPQAPYEREGDVPNVVFPTGAVVREGTVYLYYGAGDKVCALATAPLEAIVQALRREMEHK